MLALRRLLLVFTICMQGVTAESSAQGTPPTRQNDTAAQPGAESAQDTRTSTVARTHSSTALLLSSTDLIEGINRILRSDAPNREPQVRDQLRLLAQVLLEHLTQSLSLLDEIGATANAGAQSIDTGIPNFADLLGETRVNVDQAARETMWFLEDLSDQNVGWRQLLSRSRDIQESLLETLQAQRVLASTLGVKSANNQ